MSTDRPDDFDDVPTLRPLPLGGSEDDQLRDDYRDDRPPPPQPPPRTQRRPGFGLWMAALWALGYFLATQVIGAIVLGIPIIGIAFLIDAQRNGNGVPNDTSKLNEWMLGPTGRVATLTLVVATQFMGLLL